MTESIETGFSKDALERVAASDGMAPRGSDPLREEAFAQFEAMPMPSPETEEWRYTDLRHLDLAAYMPYRSEPLADSLDDVKPSILEAAGDVAQRAGMAIQHN